MLTFCHAELKVLMVGNSYTGQIRKTVTSLFKAQQSDVKFEFINPGGKTLKYHVSQLETLKRIQQGNFDILILQDQSQTPALPGINKTFHQSVDDFYKLIESLDKKPKIFLYMTWGRRDGDARNIKIFPDFISMQKALTENYRKAARKIQAEVVPVGLGFKNIYEKDRELFYDLYAKDGSHPSAFGAYLAACMFYSKLLDQDPENIKWESGLSASKCRKIKSAVKVALGEE